MRKSVERVGFRGEFLAWPPGSFPDGCPAHLDVPFAFKPFCFAEAAARGMGTVLWLDASCIAIRSLEPIFERIEEHGHLLFRHSSLVLGEWAGDDALEELGLPREKALALPEVNAAAVGLKLTHPRAMAFLDEWRAAAGKGLAFRGTRQPVQGWDDYRAVKWNQSGRVSADNRVRGHRHDQTVAGVLAHRLGMELTGEGLEAYRRKTPVQLIRASTAIVVDRKRDGLSAMLAVRVRRDKQLGRLASVLRRVPRP